MPTTNERKALWFLAIVALSGTGVRIYRAATPAHAADSLALSGQIARVDSTRAERRVPERRTKTRSRPSRPKAEAAAAEPSGAPSVALVLVDLDAASVEAIERLPGVGPALAKRIVQNRDSAGPFGHLDALCGVRGIGPGLAKKLRPLVTFTGPRRPLVDACDDPPKKVRKPRAAGSSKPR